MNSGRWRSAKRLPESDLTSRSQFEPTRLGSETSTQRGASRPLVMPQPWTKAPLSLNMIVTGEPSGMADSSVGMVATPRGPSPSENGRSGAVEAPRGAGITPLPLETAWQSLLLVPHFASMGFCGLSGAPNCRLQTEHEVLLLGTTTPRVGKRRARDVFAQSVSAGGVASQSQIRAVSGRSLPLDFIIGDNDCFLLR